MKTVALNVRGYRIGESHHNAKLTEADIDLIFYLREAGLSYAQIASKFDDDITISPSQVRNVLKGLRRAQVADRYRTIR